MIQVCNPRLRRGLVLARVLLLLSVIAVGLAACGGEAGLYITTQPTPTPTPLSQG